MAVEAGGFLFSHSPFNTTKILPKSPSYKWQLFLGMFFQGWIE